MKLKNSRCYASALYTFNRIVMQIFLKTVFSMLTCYKTNCLANGRKQTSAKQGRENTWKRFKSFERKGWKLIQECRCLSSHLSRWEVMAKLRTLHVNEMMTSLASSAYRNVSNEKKEACSNIIQHLKWPWNVYLTEKRLLPFHGEFIFNVSKRAKSLLKPFANNTPLIKTVQGTHSSGKQLITWEVWSQPFEMEFEGTLESRLITELQKATIRMCSIVVVTRLEFRRSLEPVYVPPCFRGSRIAGSFPEQQLFIKPKPMFSLDEYCE